MTPPPLPTSLPACYFTDPELFQRERERFFFHRWICAGREERIARPGDYFLCDVAGESVIVTRDTSGQVRAFYNVCRHRGARLCSEPEGAFAARVTCPYHAWSYALDGSLAGAPHMDQPGFCREDYPLHSVHAEVWEGHVLLHLGSPVESAAVKLAPLAQKFAAWKMPELRLHKRIVYDVKANWKLIILNYNECLHCPAVHPALNPLTDYLGADNEPSTSDYIGGVMTLRSTADTMSLGGSLHGRSVFPELNEAQRKWAAYYAIYPNFLLALHPDYMLTHLLWPKAVDRTEIVCEWHFHPDQMSKPDFQADDAVAFWDQVNREDWHVSELSQQGISSRAYVPGPYSKREELLQAFDREVLAADGE
jgi:phenylpropionate dioxygenase-like ring-hydroxylating dioxygenase large terminal subunit